MLRFLTTLELNTCVLQHHRLHTPVAHSCSCYHVHFVDQYHDCYGRLYMNPLASYTWYYCACCSVSCIGIRHSMSSSVMLAVSMLHGCRKCLSATLSVGRCLYRYCFAVQSRSYSQRASSSSLPEPQCSAGQPSLHLEAPKGPQVNPNRGTGVGSTWRSC